MIYKTTAQTVHPKFQTILATTDFSDESLLAVRFAMYLRGKTGSTVTLLHVVEPAPSMSGMELVALAQPDSEVAAWALTELEALARREAKNDKRVVCIVRTGKPFHEITLAAKERAVDLIVIATHGHTGFKRLWLGSTAECVVRHAPCSVLTVPARKSSKRTRRATQFRINHILVPIDFSRLSNEALPYAIRLAKKHGAMVTLIHVVQRFPTNRPLGAEMARQTHVPPIKQAAANLECMAKKLSKTSRVKVSIAVRDGTPFEEICRVSKTIHADLIVLTTHGYTGLKHVWLGSTAERVVRHAHCPVLVVRERKARSKNIY
jgi:nucleotide-binding universal stress UspA family protein